MIVLGQLRRHASVSRLAGNGVNGLLLLASRKMRPKTNIIIARCGAVGGCWRLVLKVIRLRRGLKSWVLHLFRLWVVRRLALRVTGCKLLRGF